MGAPGVYTLDHLLNDDEIEQLKKAAESLKERVILLGLLYTGMRVGELLHLSRSWINMERRIIMLPATMPCKCPDCRHERKGTWRPKTKAGIRPIPLVFPELVQVLDEYFKDHESVLELTNNRVEVNRVLKALAARAGLKRLIFPHAFRGTYARQLVKAGFEGTRLKNAMGWTSVAMADRYVKMTGDQLVQDMESRVPKIWGNGNGSK